MLHIFNRKELLTTFDMKQQAAVREKLAAHHIDYDIKTQNRSSASTVAVGNRSQLGTLGQNINNMYTYIIYVKKKDYETAARLIR